MLYNSYCHFFYCYCCCCYYYYYYCLYHYNCHIIPTYSDLVPFPLIPFLFHLSITPFPRPPFSSFFSLTLSPFSSPSSQMMRPWQLSTILMMGTFMDRRKCTRRELRTGAFYAWPMLYGWVYPQLMMVSGASVWEWGSVGGRECVHVCVCVCVGVTVRRCVSVRQYPLLLSLDSQFLLPSSPFILLLTLSSL